MSLMDRISDVPVFRNNHGIMKWADVDLGDNTQLWFAKIYGAFEGQHPEALRPGSAPSLTFDKQDFVSGYALGAISVAAGPNLLIFPVILRNKRLAPFDLTFINGNLRYADKKMIQALTHPYRPFVGLSEHKVTDGPSIDDALHTDAQSAGRTVLSSVQNIDVMADLEERIRPVCYALELEAKTKLANTLKFEEIKHTLVQDQIYKWAQIAVEEPVYYLEGTPRFRTMFEGLSQDGMKEAAIIQKWYDTALVSRKDIDRYHVKIAKQGYDGYIAQIMDSNSVRKLATEFTQDGNKVLDLTDQLAPKGGAVLLSKIGKALVEMQEGLDKLSALDNSALADYMVDGKVPTFEIPGLIHNYGSYNVLFSSGYHDTGTVYSMVDWNFAKDSNLLFVGSKYALQDRMAGQPASVTSRAPRGEPREGAIGTYVYEQAGTGFAIPPFEVLSCRSTPKGLALRARAIMDGKPLNLVPVEGVKSLVKITRENDPEVYVDGHINVYVPTAMDFIILPPERDFVIPDPQQALKLSSWKQRMLMGPAADVKITISGNGGYSLDMVNFPLKKVPGFIAKEAGFAQLDRNPASAPEVIFGLKIAGLDSPYELVGLNINRVHTITIPINPLDALPSPMKKANYDNEWYTIRDLVPCNTLYKVASLTDDEQTLDSIFSLNFINKDNMKYFMSNLGLLKDVEEFLARLLLAARIANVGVDESEISGALEDVVHIREILSRKQLLTGD